MFTLHVYHNAMDSAVVTLVTIFQKSGVGEQENSPFSLLQLTNR